MVLVSWFDLCAAFSVRPWSLPSGRPRSEGPSRPWPRQSEKSGEQASYGVPGRRRGVRVGSSVLGQAFLIRETARRRLVSEASALALRSERWAEAVDERVFVPLGRPSDRRPDYPSGPFAFLTFGPAHELHAVFLGRALVWKPVPEGPRVYERDKYIFAW